MNKSKKQVILITLSFVASLLIFTSAWLEISEFQKDKFELKVKIVGYKFIEANPNHIIDLDEEASIHLVKDELGYIDLIITTKFGTYEFEDVIIRGHLVINKSGNYFSYNLDSPREGFFMNLLFFPNQIELHVAFDGGNGQFFYRGLLKEGYTTIAPLFL